MRNGVLVAPNPPIPCPHWCSHASSPHGLQHTSLPPAKLCPNPLLRGSPFPCGRPLLLWNVSGLCSQSSWLRVLRTCRTLGSGSWTPAIISLRSRVFSIRVRPQPCLPRGRPRTTKPSSRAGVHVPGRPALSLRRPRCHPGLPLTLEHLLSLLQSAVLGLWAGRGGAAFKAGATRGSVTLPGLCEPLFLLRHGPFQPLPPGALAGPTGPAERGGLWLPVGSLVGLPSITLMFGSRLQGPCAPRTSLCAPQRYRTSWAVAPRQRSESKLPGTPSSRLLRIP